VAKAAAMTADQVRSMLGTSAAGLGTSEATSRASKVGPNAVRTHHRSAWQLLARQLRSALLLLLAATALVSMFLGNTADAVIIGTILTASVGLGFFNEKWPRTPPGHHGGPARFPCAIHAHSGETEAPQGGRNDAA
jgi:Mg2+-importing ATPase